MATGRTRNLAPRRKLATYAEPGHDPHDPASEGYAERQTLTALRHPSGFIVETLGRPLA
jgi:hypothetical protein